MIHWSFEICPFVIDFSVSLWLICKSPVTGRNDEAMSKFYLTTPLYYVNDKPHIGHAYTEIAADALARFRRLKTDEVFFLTGTDEHGLKIDQAAQKAGMTPKHFADQVVQRFLEAWKRLGISYDDFLRTTEIRHTRTVENVLKILYEKGDIYLSEYEGWYCTPCETFWTEIQLKGEGQGARGKGQEEEQEQKGLVCLDCKRAVERIKEKNYFFRLSKYQRWLIDYIRSHPRCIQPSTRRQEILSFLEQPLNDLCISRPKERLQWGIPIPFSNDHVTYVWFDALINYITAVDYLEYLEGSRVKGQGSREMRFTKFWPADVHLIGKDILRPHAVYWPIMLNALGVEIPKQIFAHGWWTLPTHTTDGQAGAGQEKISKSKGNIVDPMEVTERYGVDVFRYFLLREVPFGQDGTYSEEALIQRFNSDLANDLGNLFHRTLTMVEKYFNGIVPSAKGTSRIPQDLESLIRSLPEELDHTMENLDFSSALGALWRRINRANKFIEEVKPWALEKANDMEGLSQVIYRLVDLLRIVTIALFPFMPHAAGKMWEQLNLDGMIQKSQLKDLTVGRTASGIKIRKGEPLFPRIES